MSNTPSAPSILTRLGYDGSDLKKGFAQARQDYANYKAQAVLIETELKREKVRLATEFSVENRKQIQQHIDDLRKELAAATGAIAGKRGAEKVAAQQRAAEVKQEFTDAQKRLAGYEQQKQKIVELAQAQAAAAAKASQAAAAAGVFRETGRATGEIPGLSDLLSSLAPGLANIQQRLGAIFGGLVKLGGGIQGGSGLEVLTTDAASANAGFLGLGATMTSFIGIAAGVGVVAVATGTAMFKAGAAATSWAHDLTILSAETGISTDNLQRIQFAATSLGVELENLPMAMRKLSQAMVESSPVLSKLGVATINPLTGQLRDGFDALNDFLKAVDKLPTEAQKLDTVRSVLGRGSEAFLEAAKQGPQELQRLYDLATKSMVGNVAQLAEIEKASRSATALLEQDTKKLESNLGFTQGIWTALKLTADDYLKKLNEVIEKHGVLYAVTTGAYGMLAEKLFPKKEPIEGVPGAPTTSLAEKFFPQTLTERFPSMTPSPAVAEAPNLVAAREKLAAAQDKELSNEAQLAKNQAELNKLKSEQATIEKKIADAGPGVVFSDQSEEVKSLVKNLDEQATKETLIRELKKQQVAAAFELAKLEAEILKHVNDRAPTAKQQPVMAIDRINAINAILIPRLQAQKSAIENTPENEKALAAIDMEIVKLLNEQATLRAEIVKKQDAAKKLSEAQRIEQKLANDEASRQAIASTTGGAAPVFPETTFLGPEAARRHALATTPAPPSQTIEFLSGLKEFGDVVGKFNSSLSKTIGQMFALADGFSVVIKQLGDLSGKTGQGSFLAGLKSIITGKGGAIDDATGKPITLDVGKRLAAAAGVIGLNIGAIQSLQSGTLTGGVSGGSALGGEVGGLLGSLGKVGGAFAKFAGPIGAIAGGLIGGIAGLFSAGALKKTQKIADGLATQFTDIVSNLGTLQKGAGSDLIKQITVAQQGMERLSAQRLQTVNALSGRKGGGESLAASEPAFNQAMQQLQNSIEQAVTAAKSLNEQFSSSVGLLAVPEGARNAATALQTIAQTLKSVRDAGASADEQMAYLNASLGELTSTLGRQLRTDEQNAINLLLQEIDLQKQREDIITNADRDIAVARQKAGIGRVLTPGQQLALDIKAIKDKRDADLKANQEQQDSANAQIGAQAQLFGLTQDRNALLATQIDLEKQITAETIARIADQMDFYKQIAAGIIPNLPEGLIPGGSSNFNWNINGATIQVVLPSDSAFTPEQAAAIVREGLTKIGQQQQAGL